MAVKEKIFPGDTLAVAYDCCRQDPLDPDSSECFPETPITAYARLFNTELAEWVPLGGGAVQEAPATIAGNRVSFLLDPEFTLTPGRYKLFITAEFSDGDVLTEDRSFQVLEWR